MKINKVVIELVATANESNPRYQKRTLVLENQQWTALNADGEKEGLFSGEVKLANEIVKVRDAIGSI